MHRREFLRRAGVGVSAAPLAAGTRAAGRQAAGPTVSTRGHYRVGPFNFVYRSPGVGRYEYEATGVPGLDGPPPAELAVFVHGWFLDEDDADATFAIVRDTLGANGYGAPLVGFEWDADDVYWFDDWYPSVAIARRNGDKLARFLADLRRANPDLPVRLLGHSLGARVVLAALESLLEDDHPTGTWDGRVEHVTLLGAAAADEAPTDFGRYETAVAEAAESVDNFHTTADESLANGYRSVEFGDPLGAVGADGPTPRTYADLFADPVEDHVDYYRQDVGVLDVAVRRWRGEGDGDLAPPDEPSLPDPGDPDDPSFPDPGEPDEPALPDPGNPDRPDDPGPPERGTRQETGRLSSGERDRYTHEVSEDATRVVVTLSGPEAADFDVYVTRDGRRPTETDHDERSWSLGSDERVELDDPGPEVGVLVSTFGGAGRYTLTIIEKR